MMKKLLSILFLSYSLFHLQAQSSDFVEISPGVYKLKVDSSSTSSHISKPTYNTGTIHWSPHTGNANQTTIAPPQQEPKLPPVALETPPPVETKALNNTPQEDFITKPRPSSNWSTPVQKERYTPAPADVSATTISTVNAVSTSDQTPLQRLEGVFSLNRSLWRKFSDYDYQLSDSNGKRIAYLDLKEALLPTATSALIGQRVHAQGFLSEKSSSKNLILETLSITLQ